MNRQSETQTQSIKIDKSNTKLNQHHQPRFASLTKAQFTNWLKQLPAEERYLALKVKIPHLCTKFIALNSQLSQWENNCAELKKPTRLDRAFLNCLHSFIDGAVLISEDQHLDCFGFDFSFVGNPQKLYQCLSNLLFSLSKREKEKSIEGYRQLFIDPHREQWVLQVLRQIESDYSMKMKNPWESILIEKQKKEKKQFGKFWKNLGKQNKISFLCLGQQSIEEAAVKLGKLDLAYDFEKLSEDMLQNLELDQKNMCNKIFKCKLKKCSLSYCKYYELLFQEWRLASTKKLQSKMSKKRNKKLESKRQKSLDTCSNETNQTQFNSSRTQSSPQIFHQHLEKQIFDCYDLISEASNMFYEKRVLAFERISAVFRLYGIECKLFGSCANGITIKNSDVDIAINQKILSYFQMYEDKQTQMSSAFEFMGQIFESLPWVSNVKVIKTASTPIIKLMINTQIEVEESYFTPEYRQILNRKICNGGFVQADLTIQDTVFNHLGMVSTSQINLWLESICTLRPIIVLLKYELSKRSLNETYLGGLNTYCLVVMLVAFIYENKLEKQERVSVVFEKILKFYGWVFDEKTNGIDIREKESIFYLKNKDEVNKFADLQIKDPLNEGKLMTKNCYGFSKIKDILKQIYEACFMRMGKDLDGEWLKVSKRISKQKTKEESETESCEEKEKKNYFIEFII